MFGCSYQDVVILVCEDFGETVGASVGLTFGFAIVFALAEIFNRLLSVGPRQWSAMTRFKWSLY
jgi:hypothetical protein